ncbi:MAG: hypothetical protein M3A44_03225 [Gammaproteobacteria bacterium]
MESTSYVISLPSSPRLNRDIHNLHIHNRIEVLSLGLFPGRITPANIERAGSFARNPLIAHNLREFPEPPNVDAGEGVRMMFSLMKTSDLYPPFYRELRDQAQEAVSVTPLNEARPPMWEQVSGWIDRNGPISNADLCQIAGTDTSRASRMLKRWVEQGVLVQAEGRAKRNMVYHKPVQNGREDEPRLFADTSNNNDR